MGFASGPPLDFTGWEEDPFLVQNLRCAHAFITNRFISSS